MAGMNVGSVYATLGLDSAQFTNRLNAAQGQLSGFAARMQAQGKALSTLGDALTIGVTLPIVALGTALAVSVGKLGKYAEQLQNLSQTTDLSTKTLQQLRYVSRIVGVDFETLANTATMMQRKLLGIEGDAGLAADVMKRLGVNIHDANGQMRSMNDLYPEVIGKLQSMTNRTERNAMASQLFGRNLGAIAPILGLTTAEMDKMMKSAYVLTDSQIKMATAADDAMDKLKMKLGGVSNKLAVLFAPIISDTVVPFIEQKVLPAIDKLVAGLKKVIHWFTDLPRGAQIGIGALVAFAAACGPVLSIVGRLVTQLGMLRMALSLGGMGSSISKIGGLLKAAFSGPVGWIILGVLAIIAIIAALYKKCKEYRDTARAMWSAVKEAVISAWNTIKPALSELKASFQKLWQALQPVWELWKEWIKSLGLVVLVAVIGYIKVITLEITAMARVLAILINGWANIIAKIGEWVAAMLDAIGIVVPAAKAAADAIRKALMGQPGERMTLIDILNQAAIVALKNALLVAKKKQTIAKEGATAAKAASDEEIAAIMEVIKKRREEAEERRQQLRESMGWVSPTEMWRNAMVAGVRGTLGKAKESTELTKKDVPGAKELVAIRELIKTQNQNQKDLTALVRERLGVFA